MAEQSSDPIESARREITIAQKVVEQSSDDLLDLAKGATSGVSDSGVLSDSLIKIGTKLRRLSSALASIRESVDVAALSSLSDQQRLSIERLRAELDKTVAEAEATRVKASTDAFGQFPRTRLPAYLMQISLAFFGVGDAVFYIGRGYFNSGSDIIYAPAGLAWGLSVIMLYIAILSLSRYERQQMRLYELQVIDRVRNR